MNNPALRMMKQRHEGLCEIIESSLESKEGRDVEYDIELRDSLKETIDFLEGYQAPEKTLSFEIDITPMGAVRSNGAKSMGSPAVKRYVRYKKDLKWLLSIAKIKVIPDEIEAITFYIPIPNPEVGSKKVRREKLSRIGNPHQQKPDFDNLIKPILDASGNDDSHVWRCGEIKKVWTEFGKGKIIITLKEKYVLHL